MALTFLTWALQGGEWPALGFCRFTPRYPVPDTLCTGGWMGPISVVDVMEIYTCSYFFIQKYNIEYNDKK
jgi:hypothetical protein